MSISYRAVSLVLLMLVNGFASDARQLNERTGLNGIVLADCAAVECKDRYIKIFQGKYDGSKVINGEIVNTCPVTITDLHVDCGAFIKSMKYIPVPPYILRAVNNTECVVNNGKPIRGHPIFFKYYNSEMLPLTVTSFKCFRH